MEKSARPRTALNECVKVVVRCRPLSEKERNESYEEVSLRACLYAGTRVARRLDNTSRRVENISNNNIMYTGDISLVSSILAK